MTKTNMWFSNSSIKRKMLPKPIWPYIKKKSLSFLVKQ